MEVEGIFVDKLEKVRNSRYNDDFQVFGLRSLDDFQVFGLVGYRGNYLVRWRRLWKQYMKKGA